MRIEAVRRDLADFRLADRVFAPHYAVAARRSAGRSCPVLRAAEGEPLSQLLAGEPFDVLEYTSTHAWGRCPIDGAVGFVAIDGLIDSFPVSHAVAVPTAPIHATPTSDAPVLSQLSMGSRVAATPSTGEWFEVDGGYVHTGCLLALSDLTGDPVGMALKLVGSAAIPGGRSGEGVDAAGLIFLVYSLAGTTLPRFADLQMASAGVPLTDGSAVQAGDLIFFEDHVAMMVDDLVVVHADGTVRSEPLTSLDRFGPVVARRRVA